MELDEYIRRTHGYNWRIAANPRSADEDFWRENAAEDAREQYVRRQLVNRRKKLLEDEERKGLHYGGLREGAAIAVARDPRSVAAIVSDRTVPLSVRKEVVAARIRRLLHWAPSRVAQEVNQFLFAVQFIGRGRCSADLCNRIRGITLRWQHSVRPSNMEEISSFLEQLGNLIGLLSEASAALPSKTKPFAASALERAESVAADIDWLFNTDEALSLFPSAGEE
jgi:hypothetical protein